MKSIWTITKRELGGYFNSPVAYVFLVIFLLMTAAFTFLIGQFNGNGFLHTFHRIKQSWVYLADNLFSAVNRNGPIADKAIRAHTLFICNSSRDRKNIPILIHCV